jgi:hypothetical protein
MKTLLTAVVMIGSLCQLSWTQSEPIHHVVSVRADIEMRQTTKLPDGNELNRTSVAKFFRDSAGRTRVEQSGIVTIYDAVAHKMYVLDPMSRTARSYLVPTVASEKLRSQKSDSTTPNQKKKLDGLVIEGRPTSGEEIVTEIPANSALGNKGPLKKITRVWHCSAIQLPLLTTIQDPVSGILEARYKNIMQGLELPASLFQVPPGYEIVAAEQTAAFGPRGPSGHAAFTESGVVK